MRFGTLTLALVFCLLLFSNAGHGSILQLNHDNKQQDLAKSILYLEDPGDTFTFNNVRHIEDNQWQHNSDDVFNQAYSSSTWWLKLELRNADPEPLERLLEISYPVLDHVTVRIVSASGEREFLLGDKRPFNERPIDHRFFVIPMSWEAEETLSVFLSVKSSSSVQIPLTLWEAHTFFNHDRTQTLIHGVYFGIMFVMIIYNLFVYLAVGERNYIYYVMFVCSSSLFFASLNGFTYQYFWPGSTQWNDQAILVTLAGAVTAGGLFTHNFLQAYNLKDWRGRLAPIFSLMGAFIIVLTPFVSYSILIRVTVPVASLACVYGFALGVTRWVSGGLSARYYTIAWSSFFVGGVILALNKFNILPKNLFTEYATQIGSALEVTLLSFALAERINQERKMRFEAQQEALHTERELRQSREHALDIQKQATESLEQRVQERTKELEDLNHRLEELSDTDQLTRLKNRRFWDRILGEELARCSRYEHPLSILIMDIDHFKRFNDTYGHLIGDECLKEVAQCIRYGLRWPSDRPARFGGEEFCVLLPETNSEGAIRVAERVRVNVESLNFKVKTERVPVTVSIGVISLIPNSDILPHHLMEKADRALYSAKEAGRNKVVLYSEVDGQLYK